MPTAENIRETKHWLRTARTLSEALPYMRRYAGATFVIKFGGHAMGDGNLAESFARDIVLLKQVGINPVVVHGGGPQIGRMLDRLQIQSEFVDGLRVTDAPTVEVVEMVLAGSINKQIVSEINAAGGVAVGLSGKDGNLITAEKLERGGEATPDLGFVGHPKMVNPQILELLAESNVIPVLAPIAIDEAGQTYNINADTVAGAVASALHARRFYLLTDVAGVLDPEGALIDDMPAARARALVAEGVVTGGMIPKVETCIAAIEGAVEAAVIIDGRVPHALLLEVFTERGVGTLIYGD